VPKEGPGALSGWGGLVVLASKGNIGWKMRGGNIMNTNLHGNDVRQSHLGNSGLKHNEYRTRLFADVVTGKLDVRDVATKLFDEIQPEETDSESVSPSADDVAEESDPSQELEEVEV
jgi:hypothetical protein